MRGGARKADRRIIHGVFVMVEIKTLAEWMAERGISLAELTAVSGLSGKIIEAIASNRYTPVHSSASVWRRRSGSPWNRSSGDMRHRSNTSMDTAHSSGAVPDTWFQR